MKPEANKSLPWRIGPLLPLLVLTFSWQIAASAGVPPPMVQPAGGIHSLGGAASFAEAVDCMTDGEIDEEPLQITGHSSDRPNDLDEISLPANDKAVRPSRNDRETAWATGMTLDSIALRQPGTVSASLFPAHFSDSLHENLRERAPPGLI